MVARRTLLALLVLAIVPAAVAGSAAVVRDDSHVEQTVGRTTTESLVIDGFEFAYGDGGVTGVTVAINKSTDSLTADVVVAIVARDGATVERRRKDDVLLASDPTRVSFDFSRTHEVKEFVRVEVVAGKSL